MMPRIIYLIKRAEIEVTARMGKALEPYGITPIQFTLLYFIGVSNGDLSSAQLSRRFSMAPQSMSELVQVLQNKKLVKKIVDPAHRRILRISLTPKGKQTLADCNTAVDGMEEALLEQLPVEERDILRGLIGKILEASKENAAKV